MSRKATFILVLIFAGLILILRPYYSFAVRDLRISPLQVLFSKGDFKKVGGKVNVLLLGIPGEPYDGPYLSDTILFLQYDLPANKAYLLSIPRDIWSATLREKINAAYAIGEAKKRGQGLTLARAEAVSIVGQPIPYAAVINFSGFKKLIDELGGIDIEVERSFTDKKFPIEGLHNKKCTGGDEDESCRLRTVSFVKGKTHMDGETALRYVRSREAEGVEGSDFARARRQQKVISALKSRVVKEFLTFNLPKMKKLYAILDSIVERNITNTQSTILAKNMLLKKNFTLFERSLSDELFTVPPSYLYEGKYVLIPKGGMNALHKHIGCLLREKDIKKCAP